MGGRRGSSVSRYQQQDRPDGREVGCFAFCGFAVVEAVEVAFYSPPLITPFSTRAARSSFASVITVARSVAAAWLAFARWAVGVAPRKPTLAAALAPTVISQE